jgi:acylaminoacyl-peptidase
LFYLSSRSGTSQLWNVPAGGGPVRQVTAFPVGIIAFRLADEDRRLVVAQDVFPECEDLECTVARNDEERRRKDTGKLYKDGAAPRFMDSYGDGRFVNLFSAALPASGVLTQSVPITRGYRYDILESALGLLQDFTLSPDGKTVYFAARPSGSNQGDEPPKAIYRVDAASGDLPSLVTRQPDSSLSSPRISPDGHRLAYLKAEGATYTAPRITVWVRDLSNSQETRLGGTLDTVLSETYLADLQWSDDGKRLYAVGPDRGMTRMFSMPADGKAAFDVLALPDSVNGYALGGGRVAYIHSSLAHAPEISVTDASQPGHVLSSSNFAATGSDRFQLGTVTRFQFRGWRGDIVDGMVMKPAGFVPGHSYPAILQIHGGPNQAFTDKWDGSAISPQLFAARGYVVVMINPHGSSGYGTQFGRAVLGHWGDRPLQDLKAGWAAALKTNTYIDRDRACAMGASYGGYMALFFAGRWQSPWKCLFAGSAVFDIRSFFYANDITKYDELSFGAKPWMNRAFEQQNPARYVDNWVTPVFIVGGTSDYRVPHDQNIAAYGAARMRKVPSQILIFEGESHGVRAPQNVIRLVSETTQWFDRWTAIPRLPTKTAAH